MALLGGGGTIKKWSLVEVPLFTGSMTHRGLLGPQPSVNFCSPFLCMLSGCVPPVIDTTSCLDTTSRALEPRAMGRQAPKPSTKINLPSKLDCFRSFVRTMKRSAIYLSFLSCDAETPTCIKPVSYSYESIKSWNCWPSSVGNTCV